MVSRQILLNQVTLCADGSFGVQLLKRVVDGDDVIFEEPHRITAHPDETLAFVIERDNVQGHLAALGFPDIDTDAVKRSDALAKAHRKYPDVAAKVDDFKAYRAMEIARAEAEAEDQERAAAEAARLAEEKRIADEAAAAKEAEEQAALEAEAAASAAAALQAQIDDAVAKALAGKRAAAG